MSLPRISSTQSFSSNSDSTTSSSSYLSSDNTTLFFSSPQDEPYGVFSQWYESEFEVEGVVYRSAEQWMMVQKARLFGDEDILEAMMRAKHPAEHQALGRKTKGFERRVWDLHKDRIVEEGNIHKFSRCKDSKAMAELLLGTGDLELVEASTDGRIWSVGYDIPDAEENRHNWGENRMGEALMRVRRRLREEGTRE